MKRTIAILFMLLLLVQAIPVLHFFSERNFYTYVDEDKQEEIKLKIKKDIKECCFSIAPFAYTQLLSKRLVPTAWFALPSPYLESFTPPPNPAC